MMHLPPQAYTKETLIQAYNWLRSQPPHVQELAKSPDVLVALFSKAQMHGENYFSRTNLQGFKSELKNLASIMGDFDESQSTKSMEGVNGTVKPVINTTPLGSAQPGESSLSHYSSLGSPPAAVPDLKDFLDNRSCAVIQEVKTYFNLSSDIEAVRFLIAVGYQKIRSQNT